METFNQIVLYFFSPLPGREFLYYIPITILILGLFILSLYLSVYSRKHKDNKAFKKTFRSYPGKLQLMAVLLGIYGLLRYYYVPLFSMRFLLYVLVAITIYVLYSLIQAYRKKYPMEKDRRITRASMNEYLPKKKRK